MPAIARRVGGPLAALAAALVVLWAAADAPAAGPELDAEAWVLIDARDGERLAGRSAAKPLPIASATKLMTAHVVLRKLDFGATLRAADYRAAAPESVLGLAAGERVSVRDLLVAMLLASANDAAVTLAQSASGSVDRFVGEMNRAARRIGLGETSFANPIGLDAPGNHSSARDLAALTMALRRDERFRRIVAKPDAVLRSGTRSRRVESRNSLLRADSTVDGVKTGHTGAAGWVLVASARRGGVPLVSVVLGAPSESQRDSESARLLDYGYSLYAPRRAVRPGERLGEVAVSHGDAPLPLVAGRGLRVMARDDQRLGAELLVPDEVEGPLRAGQRIGTLAVDLDGERVGRVPARAAHEIAAPATLERVGTPLATILIVGGSMLVVAVGLLGLFRGRGGDRRSSRSPEARERIRRRRMQDRDDRGTGA